jgi:hypothetical protein
VCFLEDVTAGRGDFTIRKLSRQAPAAKVIVCLLGDASNGGDEEGGPDAAPRSLAAAITLIDKSTVRLKRPGTIGIIREFRL